MFILGIEIDGQAIDLGEYPEKLDLGKANRLAARLVDELNDLTNPHTNHEIKIMQYKLK